MAQMVYMEHDWILYLAAFACAFGISLVATPFAKKVAFKLGAVQYPRKRDMHNKPMPLMGGLAIVIGFAATMLIMALFMPYFREMQFAGFALGGLVIVATGMVDDVYELKSLTKLFMQIIAAIVVVASGIRIEIVVWPITAYLQPFSIPLTIFWLIGMTNAVNLIDGLDGLSSGVSAIGALCLMVLCMMTGSPLAVVLSATLAGSILGFLPRNFNPAEIFMGDTGALFIGYTLAVTSVLGVFKGYTLMAVLIVIFALFLPIFDTNFAFFRRILSGRKWNEGDRGHMHHRLIDAGFSPKQAVAMMYGLSLVTAIIAIVIALREIQALIVMGIFLFILYIVLHVYRKRVQERR